jgi:hypothetical protein
MPPRQQKAREKQRLKRQRKQKALRQSRNQTLTYQMAPLGWNLARASLRLPETGEYIEPWQWAAAYEKYGVCPCEGFAALQQATEEDWRRREEEARVLLEAAR